VPPKLRVTKTSKIDMSKLIEVEPSTPRSSSREYVCPPQATSHIADACSMAIPFGRPVEPEV
jgi:hypothetical protein